MKKILLVATLALAGCGEVADTTDQILKGTGTYLVTTTLYDSTCDDAPLGQTFDAQWILAAANEKQYFFSEDVSMQFKSTDGRTFHGGTTIDTWSGPMIYEYVTVLNVDFDFLVGELEIHFKIPLLEIECTDSWSQVGTSVKDES